MYRYTVSCRFSEKAVQESVVERWLGWLCNEHLQDVIDAGAESAEIVELVINVPIERQFEIRYRFSDETAFRKYEAEQAPRLRDEGLRLFPLELGLSYSRSIGSVVDTR